MKVKEKSEARRLRKEEGLPLGEIAKRLNVAKSSVSLWVRDVELTEEQKLVLLEKNPIYNRQLMGCETRRLNARQVRLDAQMKGREKAKNCSDLYKMGCMLYWAEGSKGRNQLVFCNSDPDMMILFKKFLDKEFSIDQDKYRIHIYVYLDCKLSIQDIERYWLDLLKLRENKLNKSVICHKSKHIASKGLKKGKLVYGVCRLVVNSSRITQQIFGSIKELSGVKNDEKWLD